MPDRRAPVQASTRELDVTGQGTRFRRPANAPGTVPGTIAWSEHEEAWRKYAVRYGSDQSSARLAERGGFSWWELVDYLGHEPTTWEPVIGVSRG
jgi:hypothetical protein